MDRKESSRKCYLNRSPEIKRRAINSSKRSYWENRDKYIAQNRKARSERKIEVLTHYSNGKLSCVRCGFADLRALSIDHINGNGTAHRMILGKLVGANFYKWLKNNDYPEDYQTLCMNCQFIKKDEMRENRK